MHIIILITDINTDSMKASGWNTDFRIPPIIPTKPNTITAYLTKLIPFHNPLPIRKNKEATMKSPIMSKIQDGFMPIMCSIKGIL